MTITFPQSVAFFSGTGKIEHQVCGGGRGVRGRPVLGGSLQADGVCGEEMLVAEAEETAWGGTGGGGRILGLRFSLSSGAGNPQTRN